MTAADPAAAARWLRYALEDLILAEHAVSSESATPRHACFLAQQAAEKAIKAAFVALQVDFPFIHDLEELRSRLPDNWKSQTEPAGLERLTQWAVESRYPTDDEPDSGEARLAVDLARQVLNSVNADLQNYQL
jgi:HEPN domain-containing protein